MKTGPVSALVAAAPRYRIVKAKTPRGADLHGCLRGPARRAFPTPSADERDGLRLAWRGSMGARARHREPSRSFGYIAEAPTEAEALSLLEDCRTYSFR